MIELASATSPTPHEMLNASGGFAWWYADAVDADGNGLVLIWSWGLPFLPGYTSAGRRGDAPAARERPSLNIALYRAGRPAYYLLQEYPEHDAECGIDRWRIGDSSFSHTVEGDQITLDADISCTDPTTGAEVRGSIRLRGSLCRQLDGGGEPVHVWGPITANATADVSLLVGETPFVLHGHGYHDRNYSSTHIDNLGIERWTWVRASREQSTWIVYALQGRAGIADRTIVLRVSEDGATEEIVGATVRYESEKLDRFGVRLARRMFVCLEDMTLCTIEVEALVDRGPFYLRGHATITTDEGVATGFVEVVVPGRVDRSIHRPLVRMAVHHVRDGGSIWLPLFAGPIEGRVGRLLRSFGGAR